VSLRIDEDNVIAVLLAYIDQLDREHSTRNRRERWKLRVQSGAQDPLTVRIAEKLRLEGMECSQSLDPTHRPGAYLKHDS
jgi:UDP-N-acetylenolpyruvoylglucosamine reductase